jgi:hypothetical protein
MVVVLAHPIFSAIKDVRVLASLVWLNWHSQHDCIQHLASIDFYIQCLVAQAKRVEGVQ